MREITESAELEEAQALFPGVRKVTVDEASSVAYVFVGRSAQAQTIRGEAYQALMKALPDKTPDETNDETPVGSGKPKKR